MIDHISIVITGLNPAKLLGNSLLTFYGECNFETGEIKTANRNGKKITPSKKAYYKGLKFTIYENGRITLEGSLHKYLNDGVHNYNDFGIKDIRVVLEDLKIKFSIDPSQCVLKCLELGVNVKPPINTNDILERCFLHKKKPFEWGKNSGKGKYKQVEHSQYIIKVYNKALHYNIEGEILRFEIKYTKMEKLNKKDIYSLADLLEYGLAKFKIQLLEEWDNVLFIDPSIRSTSMRINNYKNPLYWGELLKNPSPSNYNKHRTILKEFIQTNSDQIQDTLAKIMLEKIENLTMGCAF